MDPKVDGAETPEFKGAAAAIRALQRAIAGSRWFVSISSPEVSASVRVAHEFSESLPGRGDDGVVGKQAGDLQPLVRRSVEERSHATLRRVGKGREQMIVQSDSFRRRVRSTAASSPVPSITP